MKSPNNLDVCCSCWLRRCTCTGTHVKLFVLMIMVILLRMSDYILMSVMSATVRASKVSSVNSYSASYLSGTSFTSDLVILSYLVTLS